MKKFIDTLINFGRMIRFSHSIFALPFALSAVLLVSRFYTIRWINLIWIISAMVAARSTAMALNRIIDREVDRINPRTRAREIPQGIISPSKAWAFTGICTVIFVFSAFQLNFLCGILSLPVLALFILYPYSKRFTWTCHFILGLCLALAPLGAWLSFSNYLQGPILLLGLGVFFWVTGFDILYAIMDLEFDKAHQIQSIPARFGLEKSLKLAMIFHGITIACFFWVGFAFKLNVFYFLGCVLIAGIMLYEHRLMDPADIQKMQKAFNTNGYIGLIYLLSIGLGLL
jgi:4-hydroxybenzoate polyprenyltransferase